MAIVLLFPMVYIYQSDLIINRYDYFVLDKIYRFSFGNYFGELEDDKKRHI